MPDVTLTDAQLQLLQTAEKLGGMSALDNMYRAHKVHTTIHSDPKLRGQYEGMIKTHFPGTATTADIAAPYVEPVVAKLTATEQRLANLEKSLLDEKQANLQAKRQSDFNSAWSQAVKDNDMTVEGEEALAKFMQDNKLQDPESAALLYYKRNPKPPAPLTPSGVLPQKWGVGPLPEEDPESGKLLLESPEDWADIEATNVLNEMRGAVA